MKILHVLLISNLVSATIGAMAVFVTTPSVVLLGLYFAFAVASTIGISYVLARQIRSGLRMIEHAVEAHKKENRPRSMNSTSPGTSLGTTRKRWSVAANRSREQNKSVEWLIETLERRSNFRGDIDTADAGQRLRGILTGITRRADGCISQLVDAIEQIQASLKGMTDITVAHGAEVAKSTSHVEHLSQVSLQVSAAATNAHDSEASATERMRLAQSDLGGHLAAIRRIQAGVESGESRLRAMLSHTREIGAIANSIADISSRTDMLALNLSIESAHSSGASRGSSNVAEEVRRLAEQAAQAAQEVTCLVESVQFETQESIATIAQQNKDLTAELALVESANNALKEVASNVLGAARQLDAIGEESNGQIRLTSELVAVIEETSRNASICRKQSEAAVWNAGSLATVTSQFDELLEPLRDVCLPSEVPPQDLQKRHPVVQSTINIAPEGDKEFDPLCSDLGVATKP